MRAALRRDIARRMPGGCTVGKNLPDQRWGSVKAVESFLGAAGEHAGRDLDRYRETLTEAYGNMAELVDNAVTDEVKWPMRVAPGKPTSLQRRAASRALGFRERS